MPVLVYNVRSNTVSIEVAMMKEAFEYLPALGGEAPVVELGSLIPTEDTPFPACRVHDFMTLGPFVLETKGAFETEYLYERHRTLEHDYLSASGGEADEVPFLGKTVPNEYWGPSELKWIVGDQHLDTLHIGNEKGTFENNNEALYVTPQRNCVFYGAFYVRAEEDREAVICYESSGARLYVNGELLDDCPYGRVKSLTTLGRLVPVRFRKGLNRVIIKIRTGFIADGIDFCLSRLSIHPVMAAAGAVRVTWPVPTGAYLGTAEAPRQVFYTFAYARGENDGLSLGWKAEGYENSVQAEPLKDECIALRVDLPSGKQGRIVSAEAVLASGEDRVSFPFRVMTSPRADFDGTEHLFTDFHFDTTYHEEQRTYAFGAFDITRRMLEMHRNDPEYRLTLSEIDYLHPYYSIFPEDRALIDASFRDGTAEADCFYNQPNDLTSSGEGLVRNMIYGQKYHKEYLGQEQLIFAPGDVYGHPFQISQICKKGEVPSMRWLKCIVGLDAAFRHMSPDGTSIMHLKSMEVKDAIRLHLHHCIDSADRPGMLPAYPAGQGSLAWLKDTVNHTHYSVFSELNEGLEEDDRAWKEKTGRGALQTISRDLTQHHSGTLLTRSDFKQANRLAENLLVTAEKLAAIAALYGAQYPEKTLDKGWRQVLCAQHHDSITGTNNEISFVDLMIEYREAIRLADEVITGSLDLLGKAVKVPSGDLAVLVFNPFSRKRTEQISVRMREEGDFTAYDAQGNAYPMSFLGTAPDGERILTFRAELPALGYRSFALRRSAVSLLPVCDTEYTIENEYYTLRVDPALGGGIVSILDKAEGREIVDLSKDGPANRVVALREAPDRCETQHEVYTTGQKLFSDEFTAKVTRTVAEGFQRLGIEVKLGTIALVRQTITLWKGEKRIDMSTVVEDYLDRDDLFCVTFPVNVKGGQAVYDDRFSAHVASRGINKLSFQTHQYYSYSHCRILPTVQWAEVGPTVAMRGGNGAVQIGMTAIIRNEDGALDAADRLLEALTRKSIPVTFYPEGPVTDIEVRDRIAHGPTSVYGSAYGDWRLPHFNEDLTNTDTRFVLSLADEPAGEYTAKLLARMTEAQRAEAERSMDRDGVVPVYCVDRDNALSKPIDVVLVRAKDAAALNAWAEGIAELLKDGHSFSLDGVLCLDPMPAEDDHGVALLNNGNIACTVEGTNMLNMMLFHTADFYGNIGRTTGGQQLIPEQKTFSATYALYPHAGSWREGDVYAEAMKFNDPPVARFVAPGQSGSLPAEQGYLETEGSFLVTCFKAGGFDMAGMSQRKRPLSERGIVIRGFETDGAQAEVTFRTGFRTEGTERVNILEHAPEAIPFAPDGFTDRVGGASIETYRLVPATERILSGCPAREAEEIQPVYVRTWEHDLGSMPMGYFAVVGTIDRKIRELSDTQLELTVNLVNNQPDAEAKGTLCLKASGGMTLSESRIGYSVAPRSFESFRVVLTKPAPDAQGIVELLYEDDGQTFRDAYEIGSFEPRLELSDRGDRITAVITNDTKEHLSGAIALATPIETWDDPGNPNALSSVEMGPLAVELEPGERKEFDFAVKEQKDGMVRSFWTVAKLMVNGHLYFGYTHRKSPRHVKWSGIFSIDVFRDNGSQRKLYED